MTLSKASRWALALVLTHLLLFSIGLTHAQSSLSVLEGMNVIRFDQAEFQLTLNSGSSEEFSSWQQTALPDNWNVSRPDIGGYGWYRFNFSVTTLPQTLQAVYFSRASMNAVVFLNGVLIDNTGGLFENEIRNWNRPFFIRFLPRYLHLGKNEVLIRVNAIANDMGGLSEVEIGPASTLLPDYEKRHFFQLILPQISSVLVAFACIATFGFWVALRDPMYGYFAIAAGLYFIRQIEYWVNSALMPESWEQVAVGALVTWFAIFLALFAVRLLNLKWTQVEKILLIFASVIFFVLLGFGGTTWSSQVAFALHVSSLVLGVLILSVLIPKMKRVPYVESLPLAAAGVISVLLGMHDVAQRMGLLLTSTPRVSHLRAPLLILTIFSILFSRYVNNTKLIGVHNQNLEKQAKQLSIELGETFKEQRKLQERQAMSLERELILREMHDGVGNYLTIALRAASKATPDLPLIHSSLKDCMLDLRLMIDSLGEGDSQVDSVATVLGNLRYRIDPALKSEGIELVWQVQDIDIFIQLSPSNVLHISRIFQEAFTNAIKHANASQIVMQSCMVMRSNHRWAVISITDNGIWRPLSSTKGQGIANMRKRAFSLGAELSVKQTPDGSMVELAFSEERRALPWSQAESADFYQI